MVVLNNKQRSIIVKNRPKMNTQMNAQMLETQSLLLSDSSHARATSLDPSSSSSFYSHDDHQRNVVSKAMKTVIAAAVSVSMCTIALAAAQNGNFKMANNDRAAIANGLGDMQRAMVRLSVGCTPEDVLQLLPFQAKEWKGRVGAKFVTANMSPNFDYSNALEMDEEQCGVFSVAHALEHDAKYGFFLYEKANPENFVSDIGVQPRGGYDDIEVVEEEVEEANDDEEESASTASKKKSSSSSSKKKGDDVIEDELSSMSEAQKEFFLKAEQIKQEEAVSAAASTKKHGGRSSKKEEVEEAVVVVEPKTGEDEAVEEKPSSKKSATNKKETMAEKTMRLQQEKIELLEKEVEEARKADAEKQELQESKQRESEKIEHLKHEKKEAAKALLHAKETKNVDAFFDWGWWSSSLFHAEEEVVAEQKKAAKKSAPVSRRALLDLHRPVNKLVVPTTDADNVALLGHKATAAAASTTAKASPHSRTHGKVSTETQSQIDEYDREVKLIKSSKKHAKKEVSADSINEAMDEVVTARIEYPVQFITSMASCVSKHELEDTEYYPRHGVANPLDDNVFVFGACRSDIPQCGNPAQRYPSTCEVQKPNDQTFQLAVKACLEEAPVDGNCVKFGKRSEFGVMPNWDVSEVTDMTAAFEDQTSFNGDLSNWDTRNVKSFDRMFSGAAQFHHDISKWRAASKLSDHNMFLGAKAFKSAWECGFRPSGLLDFHSCASSKVIEEIVTGKRALPTQTSSAVSSTSFSTATSNPTYVSSSSAATATANVGSKGYLTDANIMDEVTDCLLAEPTKGDCAGQAFGPISTWDVSRVTNMDQLFMDPPKAKEAEKYSSFNGDLSKWDVSSVTSMIRMFNRADAFNGDLSQWDVSRVEDFSGMFRHTDMFNSDISNWNMHSAKGVDEMFMMTYNFNQDLSKWELPQCGNFDRMFSLSNAFDYDISNWVIGGAATHSDMFKDAKAFVKKFTCASADHGPASTCKAN